MKPLSATARLQFHKGFTLDDAKGLVGYFSRLGISHLYASPLLKARAGSMHGYDIVDHNVVNPELGGEAALRELVAALRAEDMGLILDIVPNHMGVGGNDNGWWLDVLEWGRSSVHSEYFDIDWDPPDATLRGRMLAPFLGSPYGECLANGELRLKFDREDGRLFAAYYDHRFPINPRDYAAVLLTTGGRLETPARLFTDLPPVGRGGRAAAAEARRELLQPAYEAAIDEAVAEYDPKTETGRDRLHRLLERQAYRLAWWRAATDEINWRRFFDVNGLAGVRVEVPEVFEDTHRTVFRLYEEGLIEGVRIDHVDGLASPRDYCRKLRRRLDSLTPKRPEGLRDTPAVLWIEKILFAHERLAGDWMTDGTTGYDFMNDVGAALHDPEGEAPLTEYWTATTGRPAEFETEAQAARRQILRESLASELFNTAAAIHRVLRRDMSTRDYTLTGVRGVLTEILVHFHTYRIYAGPGGISDADQRAMDWAMAGARRNVRQADRELLELVGRLVSGIGLRECRAGTRRQEWQRAMVRFQQLSAPTAAKSVEDTAFYRYGRLISRNEVGSEPSQFALSVAGFHAVNKERQRRFPKALLTTATHDHKRGEDARTRLAAVSSLPVEWETATGRWLRLNAPLRRDLESGAAPDATDELMLYQTLVGAWPTDLSADDAEGLEAFRSRVSAWFEKAMREAKRRSSWIAPDEAYEGAAQAVLAGSLDPARPIAAEIGAFAARLAPYGAIGSLSQAVLRMTSPGITDLYQGTEFWDFSLVDPDNRRPVDFEARTAALSAGVAPGELLADWRDGRVKLAVIHRVLQLRARMPELFTEGAYTPLKVEGEKADHIFAFARTHGEQSVIVVAVRCAGKLLLENELPLPKADEWGGTHVSVPRNVIGRLTSDVLNTEWRHELPAQILVSELLRKLPVAVLEVS